MRVGELKQTLNKTINGSNQIEIKQQAIFGGQAYEISNYSNLIDALDALNQQEWNDLDYTPIEAIKEKHQKSSIAQISNTEFDQLNSYVSSLNQRLPIFIGFLNSYTKPQDEQVINIKLPGGIRSFKDLKELNEKLEAIFKKFSVESDVEFQGFDKGSDWYIFKVVGPESYRVFIGCLKIAIEFFKLKKSKAEADSAEIELKAAAKQFKKEYDPEQLPAFIEEKINMQIENKVSEVLAKVENKNGHEGDLSVKVLRGTKELIEALGDNVEFHLSLNPPAYASETSRGLQIDYEKMPTLTPPQEPKQISTGKVEKPKANSEDR